MRPGVQVDQVYETPRGSVGRVTKVNATHAELLWFDHDRRRDIGRDVPRISRVRLHALGTFDYLLREDEA